MKGKCSKRQLSISLQWSIYLVNLVDKSKVHVLLPHRRSTTVPLETNPLVHLSSANVGKAFGDLCFFVVLNISKHSMAVNKQEKLKS